MKFLFIILALASGWYCQAQETILKGHIRNYNGEEIFILCRETEFQDTLLGHQNLLKGRFIP